MPRPKPARQLESERNLAERIRYERERKGWSYAGLAARLTNAGCAIDQSALYKIEKSDPPRRITVDELVGFAAVFGIAIEDLLLPLEVALDREVRGLLKEWRSKRRELDEVIGKIAQYGIDHPDSEALFEEMMTEGDRRAAINYATAAIDEAIKSGRFKGKTIEDMNAAAAAQGKKRGRS
ncbi:helix-turn-helix transcriptional regulator [Kribbella sp. NPDC026596]|uniref:helix-turn-helix domain-containing protein n=1 Tax=Kribbella sp. NPDC026596 TaxID=3155122 RepID=UPI0033CC911E